MKHVKKIAIILMILALVAICNFSKATTGTVGSNAARVRESASTDADILTVIYTGEEVEIVSEEGDWYKITVNGQTGYVSKSLIETSESSVSTSTSTTTSNTTSTSSSNTVTNTNTTSTYETNTVTNETSENTAVSTNTVTGETTTTTETTKTASVTEDVWIKLLPNFGSNNIKLLEAGASIEVGDELNNWVKVTSNGTSGWILKNKITYSEVTTNSTTDETTGGTEETTTTTETGGSDSDSAIGKTGTINVETANVRETASASAEVVGHLDEGDEVTIISEEDDWYQITGSGIETGYIAQRLVTVSN